MMQIVQDVAPGAKLAFHTAVESEADFASGIQALVNAGAQVIADDVTYFDEPFFQDGLLSQAANSANAAGVAYFSAAGNSGSNGYDNTAPDFSTVRCHAGEQVLNFDTTGASTVTALTREPAPLVPGEFVSVILQWDQPYVTGAPGSTVAPPARWTCGRQSDGHRPDRQSGQPGPEQPQSDHRSHQRQVCSGANSVGVDPYQVLVIGYPANATTGSPCPAGNTATVCSAAQSITVQVGLVAGAAPTRIKVALDDAARGPPSGGAGHGRHAAGTPERRRSDGGGRGLLERHARLRQDARGARDFSAKGGDPILFDSLRQLRSTRPGRGAPEARHRRARWRQ